MKRPTRKFLGLSWLGWVNVLFFQWLLIRLYLSTSAGRGEQADGKPPGFCVEPDSQGCIIGIGLIVGCLPFTGYSWSRVSEFWPFAWTTPAWGVGEVAMGWPGVLGRRVDRGRVVPKERASSERRRKGAVTMNEADTASPPLSDKISWSREGQQVTVFERGDGGALRQLRSVRTDILTDGELSSRFLAAGTVRQFVASIIATPAQGTSNAPSTHPGQCVIDHGSNAGQ